MISYIHIYKRKQTKKKIFYVLQHFLVDCFPIREHPVLVLSLMYRSCIVSPGVLIHLRESPGCSGIYMWGWSKLSKHTSIFMCFWRVKRNLTKLCCVVSLALKAASSIDVPLRGSAVQSSTYSSGSAGRAIDQSCVPLWGHSCTHNYQTDNPWWRLQLDGVHRVSVIEITNRNEARERLDGVEIHIGNSLVNNGNDNPRWVTMQLPTTL